MKLNKDTAKDVAAFVGPGAAVLGAGYADLQHTKSVSKKEREAKEETDKAEELKRKKETSGGDSETKATPKTYKSGGKVKVSSASKRADGIAVKGKTRGRMI
jgi:hypothetical protein